MLTPIHNTGLILSRWGLCDCLGRKEYKEGRSHLALQSDRCVATPGELIEGARAAVKKL